MAVPQLEVPPTTRITRGKKDNETEFLYGSKNILSQWIGDPSMFMLFLLSLLIFRVNVSTMYYQNLIEKEYKIQED